MVSSYCICLLMLFDWWHLNYLNPSKPVGIKRPFFLELIKSIYVLGWEKFYEIDIIIRTRTKLNRAWHIDASFYLWCHSYRCLTDSKVYPSTYDTISYGSKQKWSSNWESRASGGIWTHGLRFTKPSLCQAELLRQMSSRVTLNQVYNI